MEFDFLEPLASVKTRTVLVDPRQVSMAQDFCIRIVEAERVEEFLHGNLLRLGSGVLRATVLVEASLVADADAVGVVALGVRSHRMLGATRVERAVLGDVVVVADGAETTGSVAGFQLLDGEVLVLSCCAAMQHDQ